MKHPQKMKRPEKLSGLGRAFIDPNTRLLALRNRGGTDQKFGQASLSFKCWAVVYPERLLWPLLPPINPGTADPDLKV